MASPNLEARMLTRTNGAEARPIDAGTDVDKQTSMAATMVRTAELNMPDRLDARLAAVETPPDGPEREGR
jgi:hypothetical protein